MPGSLMVAIVTSEGRSNDRSALATVRALAKAGHRPIVAVSGTSSLAAGSRFTHRTVSVPASSDPQFVAAIDELSQTSQAVVVFATSDAALAALYPETDLLMNKATLNAQAEAAGFQTPVTRTFDSLSQLRMIWSELDGPLIVKPRVKIPGGLPAVRIDDPDRLEQLGDAGGIVQPFIDGVTRAVGGVAWGGGVIASMKQRYLRTYPPDAGTSSWAITEKIDLLLMEKLGKLLRHHDGIFQAQLVDDLLIDLNLRPYGSMPLALAAGLNLPDIVCRLTSGEEVPVQTGATGIRYRWIDGDLRTLMAEVRAGRRGAGSALLAALPRPGTSHSIASLSDPGPLLVRIRRHSGGRSS